MAASVEDSTFSIRGQDCCLHTWNGQLENPKGLVLIFHGFKAHGLYPTVRYAAELLAASNYVVLAPDLPGHGKSGGLSGYIPSASALLQVGVEIAQHARRAHSGASKNSFFLLGSSMGGTISLAVAQKLATTTAEEEEVEIKVTGVVLLAPMLMLSVGTPARYLLSGIAQLPFLGTMQLIPSNSTDSELQYRDAEKRKECDEDPHTIGGNLRVASASSCVEMAAMAQEQFATIEVPFLVMIADEDAVVKNQGSLDLMEKSPSKDKTMKQYPALHGLLCEPKPLVDQIQKDMLEWLDARASPTS
jgi:lysophospholipase